jgi:hypothetical protein|eukprot:g5269.t1
MAPKNLYNVFDPTLNFLFGSFISILFVSADEKSHSINLKVPSMEVVTKYLLDPAVLVGVAMFLLFRHMTKDSKKTLSRSESLCCNWHLWNSILIYVIMDGLNGAFSEYGFMPLLHKEGYQMIDRRYRRHLIDQPGGPSAYEANLAKTLNAMELFLYSWMSFLTAVSISNGTTWHKSLEVIVLTMAAYGAVLFVVPDMLNGCLNMHPMGVAECHPPFTPFNLFFVYFGVLINWIWAIVPGYMLFNRVRAECKEKAE